MKEYAYGLQFNNDEISEMISFNSTINSFDFNILLGHLNIHIIDLLKVLPNREWRVNEHDHPYFELHIIPKGKGQIVIEGINFDVKDRQLYLTGPYVKHSQISDPDDPMVEYCLKFEVRAIDPVRMNNTSSIKEVSIWKDLLSRTYPFAFEDVFEVRSKFEEVFIETQERNVGYQTRIQILITDLLIHVLRTVSAYVGATPKYGIVRQSVDEERLKRIESFFLTRYMDDISIEDLSRVLFLSPRQINRIIKKQYLMTFHEVLLSRRFEQAKTLIEETHLTIEEIAHRVGFSSVNHLYQVFKRFQCMQPAKLRDNKK